MLTCLYWIQEKAEEFELLQQLAAGKVPEAAQVCQQPPIHDSCSQVSQRSASLWLVVKEGRDRRRVCRKQHDSSAEAAAVARTLLLFPCVCHS